jgi:hypothetical protein
MFRFAFIPLLALLLTGALLAACDGDGDDDGSTTPQATEQATEQADDTTGDDTGDDGGGDDTSGDGGGDGGEDDSGGAAQGQASVTADGQQTDLTVEDCLLPNGSPTLSIVATSADGSASLTIVGVGSGANIEFNRDGEQWQAIAAILQVDGTTYSYSGTALKTDASPPEAEIEVQADCS